VSGQRGRYRRAPCRPAQRGLHTSAPPHSAFRRVQTLIHHIPRIATAQRRRNGCYHGLHRPRRQVA